MDLNLAKVFIAIYENGSVSAAADSLFITQPSVSYSLKKLRETLRDELFIRSSTGMEATRVAHEAYNDFRMAVDKIENVVRSRKEFDPATSEHHFILAMSDLGEYFYLPEISRNISSVAPGVSLEVIPLETKKLQDWIDKGTVDAVICNRTYDVRNVQCRVLKKEKYVCLASSSHPRLGDRLKPQDLSNEHHVVVSSQAGHHYFEDWSRKQQLELKIKLRTPHFSVIGDLIAGSERIAVVPQTIARIQQKNKSLISLALPFDIPGIEVCLYSRVEKIELGSHQWFLKMITEACQAG
ncbi:LysR family transcriptional regulator [Cronobacter malonaticus]|uniref:LysR family transcriptional regulator n=1 Tax=Cronobacter malonaticus TaxID=413503 RepID=UPI00029BCB82|nr:LysR family transcriptional regulator [Cronobacter malonaticus]CCJ97794.1 Transcriptional regulator, LysR family [Cronobacter malonaticus 507]